MSPQSPPPVPPAQAPAALPANKVKSPYFRLAILCMILTVGSCFIPLVGWYLSAALGAIALGLIIVAMVQGDRRGIFLLISHLVLTPAAVIGVFVLTCLPAIMLASQKAIAAAHAAQPLHVVAVSGNKGLAAKVSPSPLKAPIQHPEYQGKMVVHFAEKRYDAGRLYVSGTLTNNNAVSINSIRVKVTGYNEAKEPMVEGTGSVDSGVPLRPGQTGHFDTSMADPNDGIVYVGAAVEPVLETSVTN